MIVSKLFIIKLDETFFDLYQFRVNFAIINILTRKMIQSYNHKGKPLTLGILGGGQLAKMLALAAYRMGLQISIIENGANSPAGDMTKLEFPLGWENEDELDRFIDSCDIVTLENEFINPDILEKIEKKKLVFPSSKTMKLSQDKFSQKETFRNAGLPTPDYEKFETKAEAIAFGEKYGFPFVMKSRKFGYDGYGNATIFSKEEIESAWENFQKHPLRKSLMGESFVKFKKELAVLVARNQNGETAVYPCVETVQYRHICHEVIAPVEESETVQDNAREIARKAVEAIEGIGIFGVEMFLDENNEILINEIAPRPHNSGHYTIEACQTSQFENCIRAVLNLPLGSPKMLAPAACMINLLGERAGSGTPENIEPLLRHREAWLHLYCKKESRQGRKMGHITVIGENQEIARKKAKSAASAINW